MLDIKEYLKQTKTVLVTQDAFDELVKRASAQPEIVRCKDCKHKHLENAVWTCPFGLPGGSDFYCGYGAERRTDDLE